MSDIAEVRAALKRAQDAIILDNSGSALDAIDDALDALKAGATELPVEPTDIAEVRAALEALAKEADRFDPEEGDDDQLAWSITYGILRRARRALAALDRIEAGGVEGELTIKLQRREDGGLRVYSDDVRGLVLSGRDPVEVMADVWPALEVLRPAPPPPTSQPEKEGEP